MMTTIGSFRSVRVCAAGALVALALSRAASAQPLDLQVLRGEPVADVDSPTAALLSREGELGCSGVLITPSTVLTAAHCLPLPGSGEEPQLALVCFGPDIQDCVEERSVVSHRLHPAYDPLEFMHDLATLELDAPVSIPPATLAEEAPLEGDEIEIAGFGRRAADDPQSTGVRYERAVRIDAIETGRMSYGEVTCNGDSGGPAFQAGNLVGITSSGPPGCRYYGRSILVSAEREFLAFVRTATPEAPSCAQAGARPRSGAGGFALWASVALGWVLRSRGAARARWLRWARGAA